METDSHGKWIYKTGHYFENDGVYVFMYAACSNCCAEDGKGVRFWEVYEPMSKHLNRNIIENFKKDLLDNFRCGSLPKNCPYCGAKMEREEGAEKDET